MKLVKYNVSILLCFVIGSIWTINLHALDIKKIIEPLKNAIEKGEALPLNELPIINLIPIPKPIKKAFEQVDIITPKLTIDLPTQSAELSGETLLFGQPVIIKIRMASGKIGAGADNPPYLQEISPKPKPNLEQLAKDVKNSIEQTDLEQEKLKKELTPEERAKLEKKDKPVSSKEFYEELKQNAPQASPNPSVKAKQEVEKKVEAEKNKINELTKKAGTKIKEGAGKVKAKLTTAAKSQLEQLNFALFVGVPRISFKKIDKSLSFLDIVQFSNLAFVLATGDYYDKAWKRTFYKGFNLVGTARMSGPFEKINGIIGADLTQITLHGTLSPELFGSSLNAELPGKIKLGKHLETAGLILRARLVQAQVPIAVSILTGINVKVPNQEQPLIFRSGLTYVPPTELVIGGWMEGMWKNPLGVPYLSIGELGLQAGTDIQTAVASSGILSLSRLGIRGRMGWGSKFVEMAMSVSLASSRPDLMLSGKFEGGLYLNELVDVGARVIDTAAKIGGKKIDLQNKVKGKIPNFGLKQAELYISPVGVSLAGRYYGQGITIDGSLDILGVTTQLRFNINVNNWSIKALGYMSNVNLKFFKLTGAGKDKKRGTEDDGPVIYLDVKPSAPFTEFFIDGRVELDKRILGGASGDTRLMFSPKGIEFWFKANLFNQFMTHLEVSAADFLKPQDWRVVGKLEQQALDQWAKLLEKGAQEIAKEAEKNIPKAQAKLDDAKRKLDDINKKRQEIKEENQRNINKAMSDIRAKIDRLKREKDELERQIQRCKGKVPKEAQPEVEKKSAAIVDREITGPEIIAQIRELEKEGFNKEQIDRILKEVWAKKLVKSVTKLRDMQKQGQALSRWPKDINVQFSYYITQQKKEGMPSPYANDVEELGWIDYYKNQVQKPSMQGTKVQKESAGFNYLTNVGNVVMNGLLARRRVITEPVFEQQVKFFTEMINNIMVEFELQKSKLAQARKRELLNMFKNKLQAKMKQ